MILISLLIVIHQVDTFLHQISFDCILLSLHKRVGLASNKRWQHFSWHNQPPGCISAFASELILVTHVKEHGKLHLTPESGSEWENNCSLFLTILLKHRLTQTFFCVVILAVPIEVCYCNYMKYFLLQITPCCLWTNNMRSLWVQVWHSRQVSAQKQSNDVRKITTASLSSSRQGARGWNVWI